MLGGFLLLSVVKHVFTAGYVYAYVCLPRDDHYFLHCSSWPVKTRARYHVVICYLHARHARAWSTNRLGPQCCHLCLTTHPALHCPCNLAYHCLAGVWHRIERSSWTLEERPSISFHSKFIILKPLSEFRNICNEVNKWLYFQQAKLALSFFFHII